MTLKQEIEKLVTDIDSVEGKKLNCTRAQIKEIVGIICDAMGADVRVVLAMAENAVRREQARAKRKAQKAAFLASKKGKK